jgi:tritrans,polycis-undecaprenyl-diphosphate synthase [geranylgeranyl-diphosphate specific]
MAERKPYPKHIGIILDGNRRFARRQLAKPWMGHEWGFKKLKKLFEWMRELDVKELSLYCFSMQNFNRSKEEVDRLMDIFKRAAKEVMENEDIHKHKIKVNPIGRWHMFPPEVVAELKKMKEMTKDYDGYQVNLCMAYGGREEMVDAVKKIGRLLEKGELKSEEITEEIVAENLYLDHYPDFIIRTSGEHRTSNFLMWQSTYSEWFFIQKMWPEFEKEDLVKCIDEYQSRERRFGK